MTSSLPSARDRRTGATRPSLAFRLRGWPDEGTAFEQRLKDIGTFTRGQRRRWAAIAGGFLIGLAGARFGFAAVSPFAMAIVAGVAAVLNVFVGWLLNRAWYRWWLIYVLALLDVALAAAPPVCPSPAAWLASLATTWCGASSA